MRFFFLMSRNKLRVRQKLDYFLDFRELINSKSKTRKVVPLLEKLINSKPNFRFSRCRHARKNLHVTTQRGAEST